MGEVRRRRLSPAVLCLV